MAILQNDKRIEQLETSAGITDMKEFVFGSDSTLFVPSGFVYHKIITKNKAVIYQTGNKPEKFSKRIVRLKNITPLEGYLQAKNYNPKVSKYFKNQKVEPKKSEYKKGFFTRYFMQLASDDKASVIEVAKKHFVGADAIYNKVKMRWSLDEDIEEQKRLNLKNPLELEKTFPQIRMKIYNFIEFGKEG